MACAMREGSPTALNMITVQYATALPAFRVNVADPGYTATDLNGNSGYQTVEEGTDGIAAQATRRVEIDASTGCDQALHLVAAVRGDQDDSRRRRARTELAGEGKAVLVSQLDVDECEVG